MANRLKSYKGFEFKRFKPFFSIFLMAIICLIISSCSLAPKHNHFRNYIKDKNKIGLLIEIDEEISAIKPNSSNGKAIELFQAKGKFGFNRYISEQLASEFLVYRKFDIKTIENTDVYYQPAFKILENGEYEMLPHDPELKEIEVGRQTSLLASMAKQNDIELVVVVSNQLLPSKLHQGVMVFHGLNGQYTEPFANLHIVIYDAVQNEMLLDVNNIGGATNMMNRSLESVKGPLYKIVPKESFTDYTTSEQDYIIQSIKRVIRHDLHELLYHRNFDLKEVAEENWESLRERF